MAGLKNSAKVKLKTIKKGKWRALKTDQKLKNSVKGLGYYDYWIRLKFSLIIMKLLKIIHKQFI